VWIQTEFQWHDINAVQSDLYFPGSYQTCVLEVICI